MEPSNPTRPMLKMVPAPPRPAPPDPNLSGPLGASPETVVKMVTDLTAAAHVRKEIDADRDQAIGECLKAATQAKHEAGQGRSEAAQAKAIAARVEKRLETSVEKRLDAMSGMLERMDLTIGTFPSAEDTVRALQRESQRDLTPGQIEEREAELKRLADGTGLCGMIARGAKTDVIHAEELRRMAKEAAQEAATEGAALGVVEGARQGAALVKKHQRGQLTGIAAVAGTGTFATILAVLYALGPEGGARVAGAVRAIFTTLFGG